MVMHSTPKAFHFGELAESSLHAALKQEFCPPDGLTEHHVGSCIVDIFSPMQGIIEIQTGNFAKLRTKLSRLLPEYPLTIVYPLTSSKIIQSGDSLRRSPKKETLFHAFRQLGSIASHLHNPRLTIVLAFVSVHEVRIADGKGSWRRQGVSIQDRRLTGIQDTRIFCGRDDWTALLPPACPEIFTNKELQTLLNIPLKLAQETSRCLRKAGFIALHEQRGRELVFCRSVPLAAT